MLLTRLATQHSVGFVLAAVFICLAAGWLLADLSARVAEASGVVRRRWQLGVAVVAGLGVWTTHFVAMLGYRPDMLLSYEIWTTAASALLAIALTGGPLALSAGATDWRARALWGGLAGAGIAAMHYSGMQALEGCLQVRAPGLSLVAGLIGILSLAGARGAPRLARSRLATCLLFTFAVGGMHFLAIGGTELVVQEGADIAGDNKIVLSVFTSAGAAILFLGAFATILTARRFEAQEKAHSAVLSTALENMSNGLVYLDQWGRVQLYNRRYLEIYGFEIGLSLKGMTAHEIVEAVGDRHDWSAERREKARGRLLEWERVDSFSTIDYEMDDGRIMQVEIRPVSRGGMVVTFDDVTGERQAQRRIEELAFLDPLTKLPNRRALNARIERDYHPRQWFKLLLIDLDRFKPVNDTYGHGVGDLLLIQVATRLSEIVGPEGFVARLGGDELAILIQGDLDKAKAVAEQVIEVLAFPFQIGELTITIGCSIGLCCTDDARDATELMQFADIALYESKRNGRGRLSCYTTGMMEAMSERVQIEADMRLAIERGEMHLAYQPVLALSENRVIGYEALIRWDHPLLGPVSPARFIPLAEETGQILAIGAWVLREACRQVAALPDEAYVAVNVSAVQFRSPLLLSHLTTALATSGLPPHRLEIELTETAIVEDGRKIVEILSAIRQLGVSIAMDDFGTGYSSLSHLRDFPLDRIKIDRSFVATAEEDRHSRVVIEGITQIAHQLGIAILAEGVETPSQLDFLRSIGCEAVQGYLIGRPVRMLETESALALSA
ncbi:EAL domain-containing protein [Aureimonas sp. AU20]|uniref:EAL domain-containing protein n=1 Tax=Aureimonas sp. AU20 TaxID=1349819 RepID=UPI0007230E56|nr:EAL domain-containing protein [Aureimonas sp. AU20]ALN74575.1 hypothetical protein M673_17810 [Aureimonas sp. AU20]